MPMISLQISQDLINKLDEIQEKLEYSSRSETLRESVLFFIQEHQDSLPIIGHKIAVIVVVHEAREDILDKFSLQVEKYENIVKICLDIDPILYTDPDSDPLNGTEKEPVDGLISVTPSKQKEFIFSI